MNEDYGNDFRPGSSPLSSYNNLFPQISNEEKIVLPVPTPVTIHFHRAKVCLVHVTAG